MLDAFLPMGAILASSGFGKLIKSVIYVGRAPEQDPSEPKGRPRIQVTGPKVKPEICQICMGKIKEGTEYVRCSSGKAFHSICLARVGNCPYCRRTFSVKGKESTTTREYVQPLAVEAIPLVDPRQAAVVDEETLENACPGCGRPLEQDATSCTCGVIFVAEGDSFPCPSCGSAVKEGDACCGRCGEMFQQMRPLGCPVCGRPIVAGAETCVCGTILGNHCPECGAELSEGDSTCQTCGTTFEFV